MNQGDATIIAAIITAVNAVIVLWLATRNGNQMALLAQSHTQQMTWLKQTQDLQLESLKSARAVRVQHDETLHEARFKAYCDLMKKLGVFALFSPEKSPRYEHLQEVSKDLRGWYFDAGGLLMPTRTRNIYFRLQETLVLAAVGNRSGDLRGPSRTFSVAEMDDARKHHGLPSSNDLMDVNSPASWALLDKVKNWQFGTSEDDYMLLQYLTSALRTALAKDLESRTLPLAERSEARTPEAAEQADGAHRTPKAQ